MAIETRQVMPEAGSEANHTDPISLDISTSSRRLVFDVRPDQVLAVHAVPAPGSTMGATVITLTRSADGKTGAAMATETTLATGNGWFADIDRTASPFPKIIAEVTTPHGSAGNRARVYVFGAPKFIR